MIKLVKPAKEHKGKYIEMIKEWKEYGGPFVPCIIEYDCNNQVDKLDYDAVLKVVDDYSKGKIFDYDVDYFESSNFYFIFDDEDLIGMGEIRHNLKPLGLKTIGHIACGIRPSKRNKGYALKSTECMIEKLKEDGIDEIILCHYSENNISPKIIEKLNFQFRDSVISEVSKKEIKCYYKKINKNRILITGAVLASNNDLVNTYEKIIFWIDNKYEILSPLDTMKFQGNDYERYERAMQLLKNTKVMIAEMSSISTGQGMEIQEAATLNIPILVIAKTNSKISGLVKGCKSVKNIIYYDKIEDVKNDILNFIKEEIK